MLKNDYADQNCSIARTLEVVGERWTLLIVRELLMKGACRFVELQQTLGIAKNVLANRLEKMVARGIVEKIQLNKSGSWGEYRLTVMGKDLFPIMNALIAWGDRHASPDHPPVVLRHKTCGNPVGNKLVCECCGEPLIADAIDVIFQAPDP